MKKKGVEMSMNLIIIAAIGLLVLVILAVLVINSVNKTNTGMQSCNVLSGVCKPSCTNPGDQIPNGDCGKNSINPICCKLISIQ